MTPPPASGVKASVLLITYNHERFVAEALESVIGQRTTFPFEIIVSEDCSTDRTREIVQAFRERYPDQIRLLLSPRNLNDNSVVSRGVLAARGEYLAFLDGDDRWTSPEKLQRQVDFLERRRDCSICFHNVWVAYEDGELPNHPFHLRMPTYRLSAAIPKATSALVDLLAGNFIQTCSVMLRTEGLEEIPDWYAGLPVGDWPLYVLYAEHGDIGYLNDILAMYRVHEGGLWSMGLSLYREVSDVHRLLDTYDILDVHLGRRYHREISRASEHFHRAVVMTLLAQGRYRLALRHWREYATNVGLPTALRDRSLALAAARGIASVGARGD